MGLIRFMGLMGIMGDGVIDFIGVIKLINGWVEDEVLKKSFWRNKKSLYLCKWIIFYYCNLYILFIGV